MLFNIPDSLKNNNPIFQNVQQSSNDQILLNFNINNIKMTENNEQNEYLQSHKLLTISENEFINSFLVSYSEPNELNQLKTRISQSKHPSSMDYNQPQKPSIGLFNNLCQLLEMSYKFDHSQKGLMLNKYTLLSDDIFKYRSIKGDGNCFYRAVIFSFIEQIIIDKEIQILMNLISDIKNSYDQMNQYYNNINTQNTNVSLIVKVLILISVALKKNKTKEAYDLYIKSWTNFIEFDLGLVLYFRFSIYRYISQNQNKLYTKDFPVKIGNLLPSEYETEKSEFLFEKFYNEYLFKMGKDAEKIVIYITPFVLCIKIDVVMFDCDVDFRKYFDFVGEQNFKRKLRIALLNRREHYELIYTKEYYSMYDQYFIPYSNNTYKNIILLEIQGDNNYNPIKTNLLDFEEKKKDIIKRDLLMFNEVTNINSNNNNNYMTQSNQICTLCSLNPQMKQFNMDICHMCLINEIKKQLTIAYFKNIKSLSQYFKTCNDLYEYNRIFSSQMLNNNKIIIKNFQLNIEQAINTANAYLNQNCKLVQQSLITQIKSYYCLQCQKLINNPNSKIILPCNCAFCSSQCLNIHFTTINRIELKKKLKNFGCVCTIIYENYHIINLLFLFSKFNLVNLRDATSNLLYIFTKDKCAKCQQLIKSTKQSPILIKCSNKPSDIAMMKGDIFIFHIICNNCAGDLNNKNFFCFQCHTEHYIIKRENTECKKYIIFI